ncbi:MAG: TetR/AcrR family transcriptional regulator [Streptosporangiaceae bacterium]
MDSTDGQAIVTGRSGAGETRFRLLAAASELIGESGWGRVTTRAIAERAGLPHGTVSYHFRGKQELLVEAAQRTVRQMFPMETLREATSLEDLITAAAAGRDSARSIGEGGAAAVLMEAMREGTRDPALREGLATILLDYRRLVARLVESDQRQGRISSRATPELLATLVLAAGDGLWLHSLLDPGLDMASGVEALMDLIVRQGSESAP